MNTGQPDSAFGFKDGRAWRIGTQTEVAWIAENTAPGLGITSAIPPIFDAYATLVIPEGGTAEGDRDRQEQDSMLIALLAEQSVAQSWWLGYLHTGPHTDVVFPEAQEVFLYGSWAYVVIEAGPRQAATWRSSVEATSPLPDLMFSSDRSWLVSKLWDDDWRCLGGPTSLIKAVLAEPTLEAREVYIDQDDATPPGRTAR